MNKIHKKFAQVVRQAAEKSRQTPGGADLLERFIIPAIGDANLNIIPDTILRDILKEQQEIISNPVRFNGVSIEKIKEVFKKHGIYEQELF